MKWLMRGKTLRVTMARGSDKPHADCKAFSLPATAHGLQGRFNARTVTKRKYPGPAPVPVEPALPHLWHEPVRSLSFTKTVFSEI